MNTDLYPDLVAERARLDAARAARDGMIERYAQLDPDAAADEITKELIEVRVAEALADLRGPGAGDFFGRIDDADTDASWYIGRRHIEDEHHDPIVVDWRAPVAAPFYRATAIDPLGVGFRRRFTLDDGEIVAYLDEHLDDPGAASVAGGIPDPVLAEIGAERSGEMREIVATIQVEQDVVIRSDIDQLLIVQGGPGTGKTAVALHRVAYLLFEHRVRLGRDGVLVIGPNTAFLDYVAKVLPSLGERNVRQTTIAEMCVPRVDISGQDSTADARWKGHADRLDELEAHALDAIVGPSEDIVIPVGARRHLIPAARFAEWIAAAKAGSSPINERRIRLRAIAERELLRMTGDDDVWRAAGPLKSAITAAWPTQKPATLVDRFLAAAGVGGPSGRRRAWTVADQLLVDEANSLLNGTPFTYGHVVVDEAQDHSAVGVRVIARRSPSGSMTLVGDVAQSTTAAGQERWSDVLALTGPRRVTGSVVALTIGYRVPEPILAVANRLLPYTGVDAAGSRSVRHTGEPPSWTRCGSDEVPARTAEVVRLAKSRHRLTGVVAPRALHDALEAGLAAIDLRAVRYVHELATDEVPLFDPESVKGLEFDAVIVVNPHQILRTGGSSPDTVSARGARLVYVAMTRAVQRLDFVTDSEPPPILMTARSHEASGRTTTS